MLIKLKTLSGVMCACLISGCATNTINKTIADQDNRVDARDTCKSAEPDEHIKQMLQQTIYSNLKVPLLSGGKSVKAFIEIDELGTVTNVTTEPETGVLSQAIEYAIYSSDFTFLSGTCYQKVIIDVHIVPHSLERTTNTKNQDVIK